MNALASNQLEIHTGDGVTFTLPLAGPASRFLALTIDWFIVTMCILFIARGVALAPGISTDVKSALLVLAYFLMNIGYGMSLEWWWGGRTIGKRVVGLRVADANGLRLTFPQVLIRNVLRSADSLPIFYLLGGVVMISNSRMQRLGDLAAGTIVLRTREAPLPQLPSGAGSRMNSLKPYRAIGARLRSQADPALARVALEALKRRDQLEATARLELFAEMAEGFRGLAEFPEEATLYLTDEQYLWNVVEILFDRPPRPQNPGTEYSL